MEDERIRIITTQNFYESLISEDDIEFSKEDVKLDSPIEEAEQEPLIKKVWCVVAGDEACAPGQA